MKKHAPKLFAQTVPVHQITPAQRERMHALLEKYYEAMPREQFDIDLDAKHAVILLLDGATQRIQGFSTLLKREIRPGGRRCLGFFSGDTVLEKEFWGSRVLGQEFLRFLWREKAKNPFCAVYWFLISKGYKTYLLMANNFAEHYPRFEMPTPADKKFLLREFYSSLYPGKFDAESGLIRFEKCAGKLKTGVADTSPELIRENERVAFFERANPGWKNGDELACMARMTLLMPLKYKVKAFFQPNKNREPREERSYVGGIGVVAK